MKKVLDHCHLTGKYRGAAHSICNLQLAINPDTVKIPVILHNLKGYDSHLILSAAKQRHGVITCIPNNMEQYITFTIGDVTFIDSCQFMQSSLDHLVKNLKKTTTDNDFPEIYKYLIENNKDTPNDSLNLDNSLDLFEVNLTDQQQQPQQQPQQHQQQLQQQNEFLIDMDDDDMDDFIEQAGDYRSNPYQQPTLSDEQKEKVHICLFLFLI